MQGNYNFCPYPLKGNVSIFIFQDKKVVEYFFEPGCINTIKLPLRRTLLLSVRYSA